MFNPQMVATLQGALDQARNEYVAATGPQGIDGAAITPTETAEGRVSLFDDVDHFEFGPSA